MHLCWYGCIRIQTWSYGGVHVFVEQGERVSEVKTVSFLVFIVLSQRRNREYVLVCVCARAWVTCSHYARRAFLMAVHSLTFTQTSCRYMSSSRWSQDNLARFLVIILPTEENMRSGTAKVEGTARTFLPKRAIHGTTEEARLNSFRGFLCDGITCRCILQKAISSSVMSELDLLRGREVSGGSLSYIEESSRRCSSGTSRKCHRAQSKRTV